MSDKFPDRAEFALAGIRRGSRTFMLTSPFRHDSRIGWLTVPSGFLTDGASIPPLSQDQSLMMFHLSSGLDPESLIL